MAVVAFFIVVVARPFLEDRQSVPGASASSFDQGLGFRTSLSRAFFPVGEKGSLALVRFKCSPDRKSRRFGRSGIDQEIRAPFTRRELAFSGPAPESHCQHPLILSEISGT